MDMPAIVEARAMRSSQGWGQLRKFSRLSLIFQVCLLLLPYSDFVKVFFLVCSFVFPKSSHILPNLQVYICYHNLVFVLNSSLSLSFVSSPRTFRALLDWCVLLSSSLACSLFPHSIYQIKSHLHNQHSSNISILFSCRRWSNIKYIKHIIFWKYQASNISILWRISSPPPPAHPPHPRPDWQWLWVKIITLSQRLRWSQSPEYVITEMKSNDSDISSKRKEWPAECGNTWVASNLFCVLLISLRETNFLKHILLKCYISYTFAV